MNLCKRKGIFGDEYYNLGTYLIINQSINQKNEIKISARFRPIFDFELNEKGHEPSRAKPKILQLELWLEPARLELILGVMYAEFLTIILGPDLIIHCVIDPSLGWIQIPAKTDPE